MSNTEALRLAREALTYRGDLRMRQAITAIDAAMAQPAASPPPAGSRPQPEQWGRNEKEYAMCWCNPNLRTPHCGKPTCVPTASMNVDATKPAWRCPDCGNGVDKNHRGCWAQRLRRMTPQQVTSADLDDVATAIERIQGENRTLSGILRDCDGVLETIEPDDSEEGHNLRDLRMAIDFALDPNKRKEGMLL